MELIRAVLLGFLQDFLNLHPRIRDVEVLEIGVHVPFCLEPIREVLGLHLRELRVGLRSRPESNFVGFVKLLSLFIHSFGLIGHAY